MVTVAQKRPLDGDDARSDGLAEALFIRFLVLDPSTGFIDSQERLLPGIGDMRRPYDLGDHPHLLGGADCPLRGGPVAVR
jgi:hypothetical protein